MPVNTVGIDFHAVYLPAYIFCISFYKVADAFDVNGLFHVLIFLLESLRKGT